jgi:purine-cytosine permease-like protein
MPLPSVVLLTAPEVYDEALVTLDHGVAGEIAVLVLLSTFFGLLAVGVLPRWRWIFWLILIALLLGLARVPVGRPGGDSQAGGSRPSLVRGFAGGSSA